MKKLILLILFIGVLFSSAAPYYEVAYDTPVLENGYAWLNMSLNYTDSSALLCYNNTCIATSSTANSTHNHFSIYHKAPILEDKDRNITFYWAYNVYNSSLFYDSFNESLICYYRMDHTDIETYKLKSNDLLGLNNGTINGREFNHGNIQIINNFCFQEYSNISTNCGGLSSGIYEYDDFDGWNPVNHSGMTTDGDYTTFGAPNSGTARGELYINYTKPHLSNRLSNWSVSIGGDAGQKNLSFQIPQKCWEANENILQLSLIAHEPGTSVYVRCWNTTAYYTIHDEPANSVVPKIYEEAMQWNIVDRFVNSTYGYNGNGANFDGDGDYIALGKLSNYTINRTNTIAYWIRPTTQPEYGGTHLGYIYDSSGYAHSHGIRSDNCEFNSYRWNGATVNAYTVPSCLNRWIHVAEVYDSVTYNSTIYIDGEFAASSVGTAPIYDNDRDTFIGLASDATGRDYNGTIDSFRIWSKMLSQSQIQEEMNSHYAVEGNGLVFQMEFENYNSTHAYDENNIVAGQYGEAMTFDGVDDYVNPSEINLYNSSAFSISAWAMRYEDNPEYTNIISNQQTGGAYAVQYILGYTYNKASFKLGNGGGNTLCDDTSDTAINTWYHFIGVFNNTHMVLYVNGELRNIVTAPILQNAGSYSTLIGSNALVGFFNGSIDDVMIFNRSLTQDEVVYIYNHTYHGRTANYSQQVLHFEMNNCSIGSSAAVFSIFDESIPYTALYADFEVDGTYSASNYTKNISFGYGYNHTHTICIYPAGYDMHADLYVKYSTASGFTHRYYLINHSLNSTSQDFTLYNFNSTTGLSDLKIIARHVDDYSYYPNVIGKLQRKYVSEGVWRTVQMDKSGDYGLIFFNIIEENTDYRILYYDSNGNLLKTTTSSKFVCTSNLCEITQQLNPYSAISSTDVPLITSSYDNNTGILDVTWFVSSGNDVTIRTIVSKETMTGTLELCDSSSTASSGSHQCNLTGYSGTFLLIVKSNSENIKSEYIAAPDDRLGDHLSNSHKSFWVFAIMICIMLAGLFSPVGVIIASILSVVFIHLLGLMNAFTISYITVSAVIGIVIALKIKT